MVWQFIVEMLDLDKKPLPTGEIELKFNQPSEIPGRNSPAINCGYCMSCSVAVADFIFSSFPCHVSCISLD
ncbi:hypothetical protein SLA2020_479280 [Shorea laevis]